jgi:Tfp pilus assembly protein PilF
MTEWITEEDRLVEGLEQALQYLLEGSPAKARVAIENTLQGKDPANQEPLLRERPRRIK